MKDANSLAIRHKYFRDNFTHSFKVNLRGSRAEIQGRALWPRIILLSLLAAATLIWSDSPRAQSGRVKFQSLTIERGLSQSSVYCILQDSKGFMWFGTEDGLNRYDGYDFKIYRHDWEDSNSISDNSIRSIYEDSTGAMWIGTINGGLNKYNRETDEFTHYRNDPSNPNSLSHGKVRAICGGDSGALWIGIDGGGLNRFDPKTETFTRYKHDPSIPNSLTHDGV